MKLINRIFHLLIDDSLSIIIKKIINRFKSTLVIYKYNKKNISIKWSSIKNKFEGEEAFVLGNGPSLNKTPLYLLNNKNIMCFNHYNFLLEKVCWKPNFFCCSDNLVVNDVLKDITFHQEVSDMTFLPAFHLRGDDYINRKFNKDKIYWTFPRNGRGFSNTLPYIYPGSSVVMDGLQILKHLGFKKVYLIGVDMSYTIHKSSKNMGIDSTSIQSTNDDDPNHFDPRYFGKGKKYHQPEKHIIENVISDFGYINELLSDDDFQIINIGFNSKLDCFRKKSFFEIIDFSDEKKYKLFEELICAKTKINSIRNFKDKAPIIQNNEELKKIDSSFLVNENLGFKIYSKYIFTHLFLGPFENHYFVYKREI